MAEHTPTPWIVDEDPLEDKGYKTLITMPGKNGFQGTSIAYVNHNWNDADHGERRISWGEAEANARHIVHCVNVHDDLVKALEEIDQTPIPMINDTEHLRHTIRTIQNIAYAALSKYRGAGK
jgi:hypothetical protein